MWDACRTIYAINYFIHFYIIIQTVSLVLVIGWGYDFPTWSKWELCRVPDK